jgi:ferric-dicitrate binding protein FerR (iron transport regulator)
MAAVRWRRPLHPSLYDRLERQTEQLLAENPSSDEVGRALAVSGQSRARRRRGNARAPAQVALLCPLHCQSCGRKAGGHGFRISLEIGNDRIYETLRPGELRLFEPSERDKARAWLAETSPG